jgi:hypothetical protein
LIARCIASFKVDQLWRNSIAELLSDHHFGLGVKCSETIAQKSSIRTMRTLPADRPFLNCDMGMCADKDIRLINC